MEKSHTKRDQADITVSDVKFAANLATHYIKHWTKNEAHRLAKQELAIIPAKWGFRVGKYFVKDTNQGWRVENPSNELINNFTSKRSAVAWCIMYQSDRFKISERLLAQDSKLSKLLQDQMNYSYSKQQAYKKRDYFTVDVIEARLAQTVQHLEYARNDLEKTLNSAKYLKGIWEKPL